MVAALRYVFEKTARKLLESFRADEREAMAVAHCRSKRRWQEHFRASTFRNYNANRRTRCDSNAVVAYRPGKGRTSGWSRSNPPRTRVTKASSELCYRNNAFRPLS